MKILFRVHREYYGPIASGEKNVELRRISPHWLRVARRAGKALSAGEDVYGMFVCGKDQRLRRVARIAENVRAVEVLGRPLSPQGVKDLGGEDPRVIAYYLVPLREFDPVAFGFNKGDDESP